MAKKRANGRKTPVNTKKAAESGDAVVESTGSSAQPIVDPIPPEVLETADVSDAQPVEGQAGEVDLVKDSQPAELKEEPQESPTSQSPQQVVTQPKSSFLPLVFGGLLAGVIGFGLAYLANSRSGSDVADQISDLEQEVAALPVFDPSTIEAAQSDLSAQIGDLQSQLSEATDALDERITALEQLPRGEGVASVPSIAAYEAELEDLRAEIESMSGAAVAQLQEAREEAAAIEENADAAARAAAGRAALARIQVAMETGAPLGAALTDLEAAIEGPAPDALTAAADGVPTLSSLQETFPEVARAALATARNEGVAGEEESGIGAFLRNQFEVRSVAPKEGDTTDAILSRAEAALRDGRLSDTLAETAALPEVARAEMSDWLARAELRASSVAAVDILLNSLNDN